MTDRRLPHGGGILLALAVMVPFWLGVGACAWTPRVVHYPKSGLTRILGDQALLDKVCSKVDDKGVPLAVGNRYPRGCYDPATDTEYLLNNCEGAKAILHEDAHRDGIADPEKAGFNW